MNLNDFTGSLWSQTIAWRRITEPQTGLEDRWRQWQLADANREQLSIPPMFWSNVSSCNGHCCSLVRQTTLRQSSSFMTLICDEVSRSYTKRDVTWSRTIQQDHILRILMQSGLHQPSFCLFWTVRSVCVQGWQAQAKLLCCSDAFE